MFKFFGSVAHHISTYFLVNLQFITSHWIIFGVGALLLVTAGVLATRKIEG